MTSFSFRRKVLVLLLVGAFNMPWALAAEPLTSPERAQTFDWAPLDLLSGFWRALITLWGEEGCTIDPYGRCITSPGSGATSGTTGDNGCTIDPSGRCLPTSLPSPRHSAGSFQSAGRGGAS